MLEIKDLTISIEDRYLIKNLNLILNSGDKVAIIGEEGNGKSTLLKAILGGCSYANITGSINYKGNSIGYLEQSISYEYLKRKVYDFLFIDDSTYYEKLNILYKKLDLVGLDDDILDRVIDTLSGGEKVKISILKLLLFDYDIYFLDEPTNDLDIDTLKWLEEFINNTNKPILYVSHDETLLSNTANTILHIEQLKKKSECKYTLVKCDYDTYVNNRIRSIEKQTQIAKSEKRETIKQKDKLQRVMQTVEYQQNTISRAEPFVAAALKRKMHSLKAQEKKLDEKEITEIPDVEEAIYFNFDDVSIPKTKGIISIDYPMLVVDNKVLATNIKLDIIGNVHLCIIGKNGVGKSTLIKKIYEELKSREDIKVGYMPQNYDDIFDNYKSVIDYICPSGYKDDITRARTFLGNMNFTKDEMTGSINDLSNGTKAKLFLCKLVLDRCNVLILDEPTRNLSPLSNPVIRKVLKNFKGTIISVSHDRKYIDEVIDSLYTLNSNGLVKEM